MIRHIRRLCSMAFSLAIIAAANADPVEARGISCDTCAASCMGQSVCNDGCFGGAFEFCYPDTYDYCEDPGMVIHRCDVMN
ncbi:MAG: hypothetical protein HKN72_06060 [Gemmatimonadetes bacterium]|nr:hypothetical protein [Gemmatimonadota bacterium]